MVINQHRGKFPSLVARQPPPIKITIESHRFHAGIINSRMQLPLFKEKRGQTTSQLLITCSLIIRNKEWKYFLVLCQLPTYLHYLSLAISLQIYQS